MKKKLFSILITFAMAISVMACGGRYREKDSQGWNIDFSEEPTTITMLTIGDKPTNGETEKVVDKINEILLRDVNARLDIYYVSWNDYQNKYNTILDSGNVDIDLVGTGADWLYAWPNVLKGNYYPLSKEMLSVFCPNTYESVKSKEWNKCSYNGNIYFIPENDYTQWTNHGFIYRSDIARQAGIESISTWEDLDTYVSYVTDNRSEMVAWDADGTNLIIGLGYIMSKTKYVPVYELGIYGLFGAYQENINKIVSPYYEGDEYVEFAKLMKEWNAKGVWRDDFTNTGDNTEEFYNGSSALLQHHTQNYYTEAKPTMDIQQTGSDVKFYWFGKESGNLIKTSILHGAMAVYSKSKNPEKALMVYDKLRNDEKCYRLLRYGIEGRQYKITKEGTLEKPSGYNTKRDSIVTDFWWGRKDELEIQDSSYAWSDYYKLLENYNHVAIEYPWDNYHFVSNEIIRKYTSVVAVCDEYLPLISYGRYDKSAEEEIKEFRQKLKNAGIEDIIRELQYIVDTE